MEGLDGSGKATQSGLLLQRIIDGGCAARLVSFPDYDSDSSALVRMYLDGQFGTQAGDVNAWAASTFYAVDRFASYKTDWADDYAAGATIIADRYTTSNYLHQGTKLPREEWPGFVAWLEDLEYQKMGIPRPDMVLYLDVEPEVSQQLLAQRYAAEGGQKDIHEKDIAYLRSCRSVAEWCIETLGWTCIQCSQNGVLRPREDIAQEIEALVGEAE